MASHQQIKAIDEVMSLLHAHRDTAIRVTHSRKETIEALTPQLMLLPDSVFWMRLEKDQKNALVDFSKDFYSV